MNHNTYFSIFTSEPDTNHGPMCFINYLVSDVHNFICPIYPKPAYHLSLQLTFQGFVLDPSLHHGVVQAYLGVRECVVGRI